MYTRDELLQSIFAAVSVEVKEGNRRVLATAIQQSTKLLRPPGSTDDIVLHAKTLSLKPPVLGDTKPPFSPISFQSPDPAYVPKLLSYSSPTVQLQSVRSADSQHKVKKLKNVWAETQIFLKTRFFGAGVISLCVCD